MRNSGFTAFAALTLAACGGGEPKEGALTADEEQQLNDAAAMLDEPVVEASDGQTADDE